MWQTVTPSQATEADAQSNHNHGQFFPPDAEEMQSERSLATKSGKRQAMLSKFLTSADQPKVEATSTLSKMPPVDHSLYETVTEKPSG